VLNAARWKCRTQKIVKNRPSGHHRTPLSGHIFATKAHIDNREKLLSSNISSMSPQYGELRLTSRSGSFRGNYGRPMEKGRPLRPQIRCLPYFHTWCGLSANLECRSEMCCTRLARNAGRKKIAKNSPSGHHRTTLSGYIFATKARIVNRKKNF